MKQFSIPEPCHEDWDAMTPKEKGRFCDACKKCVVDFTNMQVEESIDYLEANENICGVIEPKQLKAINAFAQYGKNWKKVAAVIAGIGLTTGLNAQTDSLETNQSMVKGQMKMQPLRMGKFLLDKNHFFITGKVTDNDGKPVVGATVRWKDKNVGTVTDVYGSFQLRIRASKKQAAYISISYVGLEERELKFEESSETPLNVILLPAKESTDDPIHVIMGMVMQPLDVEQITPKGEK